VHVTSLAYRFGNQSIKRWWVLAGTQSDKIRPLSISKCLDCCVHYKKYHVLYFFNS